MSSPDIKLPPFEHTSMEEISRSAAELRDFFQTNQTKDVEWRLVQLRKLWWGLQDYKEHILAALKQDLNKPAVEAVVTELNFAEQDLHLIIKKLKGWAKDDNSGLDYPLTFAPVRPRLRKDPLGAVLIIGTYNFPFMLNLCPLIGAVAAGCTAVLKPSENAPATAVVLKSLVEACLDPAAYRVVLGAVPETTALLDERWAKIMYTGNATVARIIARKAAETLTPVTLELGGRNPAFVTPATDLALAARRLLWGKTLCAGQVCMSQNYTLVERAAVDDFVRHLNAACADFYPQGARASPDYARVINERQFDRIKNMLDTTRGKIVMGGETDREDLFIAPTAVLVDSVDDPMIKEESFGPVWSILPYDDLDDAIKIAKGIDPTPLSLMTFGSKSENDKILGSIISGGASLNDAYMHGAVATLPFGGVGESGTGAYHGRASFDNFTHCRLVVETPGWWMDKLLRVRYPPYLNSELRRYEWLSSERPDFGRDGRPARAGPVRYWLGLILGLGGSSARGALFRWVLALASGCAAIALAADRGAVGSGSAGGFLAGLKALLLGA
ncbi:Hexadecenal dehydrogenase [Diatrype stigma]|uniref:Aldehyde dehydrogenase n=1 Tax=Diatrype stigma TaxID=117547 RepID=A0AAN9YSU8_9PEZI